MRAHKKCRAHRDVAQRGRRVVQLRGADLRARQHLIHATGHALRTRQQSRAVRGALLGGRALQRHRHDGMAEAPGLQRILAAAHMPACLTCPAVSSTVGRMSEAPHHTRRSPVTGISKNITAMEGNWPAAASAGQGRWTAAVTSGRAGPQRRGSGGAAPQSQDALELYPNSRTRASGNGPGPCKQPRRNVAGDACSLFRRHRRHASHRVAARTHLEMRAAAGSPAARGPTWVCSP